MGKPRPRARPPKKGGGRTATACDPSGEGPAQFTHSIEGPVLVLLFASKAAQLDALARIETFYEGRNEEAERERERRSGSESTKTGEGEGSGGAAGRRYLTTDEARRRGVCAHYVAFNCTVRAVREWLALMWDVVGRARSRFEGGTGTGTGAGTAGVKDASHDQDQDEAHDAKGEEAWWEPECTVQERHLLRLLRSLGCLDDVPFGPSPSSASASNSAPSSASNGPPEGTSDSSSSAGPTCPSLPSPAQAPPQPQPQPQPRSAPAPPTYLISALASQRSDLTHERLHALFHLSRTYATTCQALYASPRTYSPRTRVALAWELRARGYAERVWVDEWQAYLSEDVGAFGGRVRGESEGGGVQGLLWAAQEVGWREIGLGGGARARVAKGGC